MPPQSRLGDKAFAPVDVHGCPACPHPVIGPAIGGSPTVMVNARPALRVGDTGIHAACCGPNIWHPIKGAATVLIDGLSPVRLGDPTVHCGGLGFMLDGSPDVLVGDAAGGEAGSTTAAPPAEGTHNVHVTVTGASGAPLSRVRYALTLPDGSVVNGVSDEHGVIQVTGLSTAGDCRLVLPDLDHAAGQ